MDAHGKRERRPDTFTYVFVFLVSTPASYTTHDANTSSHTTTNIDLFHHSNNNVPRLPWSRTKGRCEVPNMGSSSAWALPPLCLTRPLPGVSLTWALLPPITWALPPLCFARSLSYVSSSSFARPRDAKSSTTFCASATSPVPQSTLVSSRKNGMYTDVPSYLLMLTRTQYQLLPTKRLTENCIPRIGRSRIFHGVKMEADPQLAG